ncbi:MAG: cysteine synthase A [Candidatus Aenigmatarchaeota archaeon]
MSDIFNIIGNTPVVELKKINNTKARIFAKLENLNPSGSIKDVMAWYIVKQAEKRRELKKGQEIIEVTSGNTGISFAMISAIRGYKFTAIMPENMSKERTDMMKAFGAKVILTPAKKDMAGACKKFDQYIKNHPKAFLPRQFCNPDNFRAHEEITYKEFRRQVAHKIDFFVAGIGTGGTLMGMANALHRHNPKAKIIGIEPAESAVINGKKAGTHGIQGIGEGFIPELVDVKKIDKTIAVSTKDSIKMARRLALEEGLMVGISSGTNVLACLEIAKKNPGAVIATVLPDRGERYLSMGLY